MRPEIYTNQTINLRTTRKNGTSRSSGYSTYNTRRSSLSVKHLIHASKELLRAEIGFSFRIQGDSGAIKLSESKLFSGIRTIDDAQLKKFLGEYCSGHWKNIFDGVTHGNRRDAGTSNLVSGKVESLLNTVGEDLGLYFSDVSIRWRASDEELSIHNRASSKVKMDKFDSELEKEAIEDIVNDKGYPKKKAESSD